MKRLCLSLVLSALTAAGLWARVVDISPHRGQQAPSVEWVDDTGSIRRLSDFAGFPVLVLPIYSRCQTACVANVSRLKTALSESSIPPSQFRVLLFSFDQSDTPSTLANYRRRENIPLGWYVGTASKTNIEALLDAVGFQYGEAGSEFMHANVLFFLDSKLRVAKWVFGTNYTGRDVDGALKIALGETDWIGQHSEWLYAILLFAGSLLSVALVHYLRQLFQCSSSKKFGYVEQKRDAPTRRRWAFRFRNRKTV